MKKWVIFLFLAISATSASAMVRAGVNVGPDGGPYYDDGGEIYFNTWYGPGWYYGNYYYDYPSYYAWQRRHYYGGPYYWRYRHYDRHYHGHDRHGGGGHRH